jgi:hypothetical protein
MDPASMTDMMLMPTTGEEVDIKSLLLGRPNVRDIFAQPSYISTIKMDIHNEIHDFVNNKVTIMRACGGGTHLR